MSRKNETCHRCGQVKPCESYNGCKLLCDPCARELGWITPSDDPPGEYCAACGTYLAAGEFSPTVPSLCNRCNSW